MGKGESHSLESRVDSRLILLEKVLLWLILGEEEEMGSTGLTLWPQLASEGLGLPECATHHPEPWWSFTCEVSAW